MMEELYYYSDMQYPEYMYKVWETKYVSFSQWYLYLRRNMSDGALNLALKERNGQEREGQVCQFLILNKH
jgi:hypothetical protein